MRHSKRIELLFNYLGIKCSSDVVYVTVDRINFLCKLCGLRKIRVLEISNGTIKLKK